MSELILLGGEQEHQAVKKDGICTCLAASMGMGGGYVPILVFEIRRDEGGGKNLARRMCRDIKND